jgi:hypothetical protein
VQAAEIVDHRFHIRAPSRQNTFFRAAFCSVLYMLKSSMSLERGYKNADPAKTLKKSGLQKQYWKNVDKMWIKSPYCPCRPGDRPISRARGNGQ